MLLVITGLLNLMGKIMSLPYRNKTEFLKRVSHLENTTVFYDRNNIVIIKVGSFEDCSYLFNHPSISWCIANSRGHWNEYVSGKYKTQWFILDFNTFNDVNSDSDTNLSMIGFTMFKDEVTDAYARNDKYIKDDFDKILEEKNIYDFVKNGFKDPVYHKYSDNIVYYILGGVMIFLSLLLLLTKYF